MAPSDKRPIYLDHHATTPLDPRVLEAMMPYLTGQFGNPASQFHVYGREAKRAVEAAREALGAAIQAKPADICFTSGATESLNLAIKGVFQATRSTRQHFVTVATEHPAVLDPFRRLEAQGAEVTFLPVDAHGLLDPQQLREAIRPETKMVCISAANHEIGVLQPLAELGTVCAEHRIPFLTDATQALGKIPLDVEKLNLQLLAGSAHKLYGPKGVGFLYCRRHPELRLQPLLDGGGQEAGLRSGTLNVPGVVGFAAAMALCLAEMPGEQARLRELRDTLLEALRARIPDLKLNGHPDQRLAANLNLCLPGVEKEALMLALADEVALSSGSACTSLATRPSHVLTALGLSNADAHASIRLGLGRGTDLAQVHGAAAAILRAVGRLRELNPGW